MKRYVLSLGLSLLLLSYFLVGSALASSPNLITNGSFEDNDANSPVHWSSSAWKTEVGSTSFSIVKGLAFTGEYSAQIVNDQSNDARWTQVVTVEPETLYKISTRIMTEGINPNAKGANITVEGVMSTSRDLHDTDGNWEYVELYVQSGPDQSQVEVQVRLGFYGSTNTGKALFDDMVMEKVDAAPSGTTVISLSENGQGDGLHGVDSVTKEITIIPMIVYAMLFAALFVFLYRFIHKSQSPLLQGFSDRKLLLVILLTAFVVRLVFAISVNGYDADINLFKVWASHAFTNGLSEFYGDQLFVDYPPGYVYVLYIIGGLQKLFVLEHNSVLFTLLIKLPSIIADLIISYFIYRLAVTKFHPTAAICLVALYAFNPAIIVNSAGWGQVDAFYMMVILFAMSLMVKGKLPQSTAVFALAFLIKPQALMFGPLLLLAVIGQRKWSIFGRCVLYGLPVIIVLALPFTYDKPGGPLWLYELYSGTLSQYPYASLNAFNLFTLIGGNWQPVSDTLLGIPYTIWSVISIGAGMAYAAYLYVKSKWDHTSMYYIGFFFMVLLFMVTVKMHERYLFYGILLGIMSFIHTKDRRLLHLFAGFSLTLFINTHYVLINSWVGIFHIDRFNALLLLVSLANTLMLVQLIKVGWDIYIKRVIVTGAEVGTEEMKSQKTNRKHVRNTTVGQAAKAPPSVLENSATTKFTKLDIKLMLGLTCIYAIIALFNLGSLKSPETYWKPASVGESFIVDLGQVEQLERMNSFAAVGDGIFKLQVSEDAISWSGDYTVNRDGGNVFSWHSLILHEQARYIRVTVEKPGTRLIELGFFAEGQAHPLTIQGLTYENKSELSEGSIELLFDEQNGVAYKKTYLNSMYFDEIYHGRTAYEHTNQIEPFETTHPPLGKIMIAIGTWIFGMNPFGWRIAGTLFGILMIPIMYMFAKRLFHKTEYAFIAAFLLTFDAMHFVQTRISTIDVYGVFFIMLMFYYMYRYYCMSFYRDGLKRTLIPLGLCGLFFGLGVAAKWISLYAGVGLAIIFFISLFERYFEFNRERKRLSLFPRYTTITIGWCVLTFILIPLIIYTLSYIPFMQVQGPGHELKDVVSYQKHMYNYHNNLVTEHPFASTWYEWPTMKRPMWYYGGTELPADKTSVIVSLGNPAIWGWIGIISILLTLGLGLKNRDKRVLFIAIALGSVYAPWMLVDRLTFIYHFFAAVPFMIVCITYVIMHFKEKAVSAASKKWARYTVYGYLGAVLLLFILFYPILSGMVVDREYVDSYLKWKDSWFF